MRLAFSFAPPVIPGIGPSGGVTLMLEDRAGKDPAFLAQNRPLVRLVPAKQLSTVPTQVGADPYQSRVVAIPTNVG